MEKNIIAIKGIKKTNLFTNLDAILFALMISKLVIKEKPENGVLKPVQMYKIKATEAFRWLSQTGVQYNVTLPCTSVWKLVPNKFLWI